MGYKTLPQHQREVKELCATLKQGFSGKVALQGSSSSSNQTRNASYKQSCSLIPLKHFNALIEIDVFGKMALVEPGVTMEELANAALDYHLVPEVVPEFRGITVGGAISGAALESTSHRYGQFSDTCLFYDAVLSNGTLLRASPQEHPDLFYGISASYGTLALIVLVAIRLKPAKKFVRLTYRHYHSHDKALKALSNLLQNPPIPDFLEGLVLSPNSTLLIQGNMSDQRERYHYSQQRSWSQWFYQHASQVTSATSQEFQESMPLSEYLFRHDRGAFWMGSCVTQFFPLLAFLFQRYLPKSTLKAFISKKIANASLTMPGPIFRCLFGRKMDSQSLYRVLHAVPEAITAERYLIQDCYVPLENSSPFLAQVMKECSIFPLWICPVKATQTPQILSPHYHLSSPMLLDVGIYGLAPEEGGKSFVRKLEALTHQFEGRKMLYTYSHYSPAEFWEHYDRKTYQQLRNKYSADTLFLDITEKVLSKE